MGHRETGQAAPDPVSRARPSLFRRSVVLAGAVLALAWFKYFPIPFLGPAIVAAVFSLLAVRRVGSDRAQAGLIAAATIALTLGGAEAWFWIRARTNRPPNLGYPPTYLGADSVLGYAPVPGSRTTLR